MESKDIINSPIWHKPPLYFKVWHYLLIKAQYSDYGRLKRGQLVTTVKELQKACSYKIGYRTETPTAKQIRTILEWLRNPDEGVHEGVYESPMIVTTKVTSGILVTICNYNVYQDQSYYEGNNEGSANGLMNGQRRDEQGQTKKKEKKEKKKKEINNIYWLAPDGEPYAQEVLDAISEFVHMRNRMRKPMTDEAKRRFSNRLNKLASKNGVFDEDLAVKIINRSVDRGWQGIFEYEDDDVPRGNRKASSNPFLDMLKEGEILD